MRKGFLLPNNTYADVEYLDGVFQGPRWAPEYEKIKIRPCPRPPPKANVLREVQETLELKGLPSLGDCTKKHKEMRFFLIALATFDLSFIHKFTKTNEEV